MNVLMMGLPFGTPGELLEEYVSREGHVVRTAAAADAAIPGAPAPDYVFGAEESAAAFLGRIARDWTPELWFCWCPEAYPPPPAIEEAGVRTVAVISDWSVHGAQLARNLARYDAVIGDLPSVMELRTEGAAPVHWQPVYARRPGVHEDLGFARDIDIAFAGNLNDAAHPRRNRLLARVAALSDRLRVVIASDLGDADYAALLNRTRIAFNASIRGEMNLRCFEAIACGACLMIEADNREAARWLPDGAAAVHYTEDTLEARIAETLADEPQRAAIAAEGRRRSASLDGASRLDGLIAFAAELPSGGRTFRDFPPEEQALAEVLQYAGSRCESQRRHARRRLEAARADFPEDVALKLAEGCLRFEEIAALPESGRKPAFDAAVALTLEAAHAAPACTVPWMNLAAMFGQARAPDAEARMLERALQARDPAHGGLLLGGRRDPYHGAWRDALARGREDAGILHAAASSRRARIALEAGALDMAAAYATASLEGAPDFAAPCVTLASVHTARGAHAAAAAWLERAVSLVALDSGTRLAHAAALSAAGRVSEARAALEIGRRIFSAWQGAEHAAARFRAALERLEQGGSLADAAGE